MEEMRELVENYKYNLEKLDRLNQKLFALLDYNTKISANYDMEGGKSIGTVSSKVENLAIKIQDTEEKIFAVGNQISVVDIACRVLNNSELEVIDLIKEGYRNKLTKIAKAIGKDKNYVKTKRDTAIKKMSEYIGSRYDKYMSNSHEVRF